MRGVTQVLFGVMIIYCTISNLYQSRHDISQFIEICYESIGCFTADIHRYIQQKINYSANIITSNERNIKRNYAYDNYEHECPQHQYFIRVIERRPLIIYIEEFLTQNEIQHLVDLANPLFQRSTVVNVNGTSSVDDYRTSSTAYLSRGQTPIVKCIEKRFAQFQGDIDPLRIEPLQVVKYDPNQQYKHHHDWLTHPDQLFNGGQRMTTFFTYLQSNCSLSGTEFNNIKFNASFHSRFCNILICDDSATDRGIRFRPLPGNSVFWYNMNENGDVDDLTSHAGLPAGLNGHKIGLNTWTREHIFSMPED